MVLITTVFVLGVGNANIYFINTCKLSLKLVTSNAVKFAAVQGVVLACLMGSLLWTFSEYFGGAPAIVIVLFSGGAGALVWVLILQQILTAQLAAKQIVIVNFSRTIVPLGVGSGLALCGKLNINYALVLNSCSIFVALAILLFYLSSYISLRYPFDWHLLKRTILYGLKLAAANTLYLISLQTSVILLRWLEPNQFAHIGLYTRASTVAGLVLVIVRLMGPLLYAKWSAVNGQALTRQLEMALRCGVTYGCAMAIPVLFGGKWIILLLYGSKFLGAQNALTILAPALVLSVIFSICSSVLAGDGRAMITTWILISSLALQVVVTFVLVPVWGIKGAAMGVLTGNLFTALACLAVCHYYYHIRLQGCIVTTHDDTLRLWQSLRQRAR